MIYTENKKCRSRGDIINQHSGNKLGLTEINKGCHFIFWFTVLQNYSD